MQDIKLPPIQANSRDEWAATEERIKELPACILDRIERVESSGPLGINCFFRKTYDDSYIPLPKQTTQIKNFGDYIGVYCDRYFFRIPCDKKDSNFSYLFVDMATTTGKHTPK